MRDATTSKQRGSGEGGFLFMVIGLAVLISVGYFVIGWIQQVKEERSNYGRKKSESQDLPPPKSVEEMGGYEVTF